MDENKNVLAFLEPARTDKQLCSQLEKINGISESAAKKNVIELANKRGIPLAEKDIEQPVKNGELSDSDLGAVAGGANVDGQNKFEYEWPDGDTLQPAFRICVYGICVGQ